MPFELPPLRYDYDALAPVLSREALQLHHSKHHQTYVDKLNAALAKAPELEGKPLDELLSDLSQVPSRIRKAVKNHGGGHANHSLMWDTLSPGAGPMPENMKGALERSFGTVEKFKARYEKVATELFGSGWAYLVAEPGSGKLEILSVANQDSPLQKRRVPLLPCDVWEHAYYVDYRNRRAEWVKAFWNLVDWPRVARKLPT